MNHLTVPFLPLSKVWKAPQWLIGNQWLPLNGESGHCWIISVGPRCLSYFQFFLIEICEGNKFVDFNSQAGGMAVARPYGFGIDLVRNPIFGSAAWFFVIILKLIFKAIFKSKFMKKIPWREKKNSFSKPDFHKLAWELRFCELKT